MFALLHSQYLNTDSNPCTDVFCCVSRSWSKAFTLVRAQKRWDYMIKQIKNSEGHDWLFHKISYLTGGTRCEDTGQIIPREGCLRIYRSNCVTACNEASKQFRANRAADDNQEIDRTDSRPDYYYRAYRETPESHLDIMLPRPLYYKSTVHFVNDIEYDEKPRLVNRFATSILGDCIGVRSQMAQGNTSCEGNWDLGYHEIVSVRDMAYSSCQPRPPKGGIGEDTTSFLNACKAKECCHPRWIKFAHLVGEDQCRKFLKKHVLPAIGPRPNGTM